MGEENVELLGFHQSSDDLRVEPLRIHKIENVIRELVEEGYAGNMCYGAFLGCYFSKHKTSFESCCSLKGAGCRDYLPINEMERFKQ